jgi:hypothetical protein
MEGSSFQFTGHNFHPSWVPNFEVDWKARILREKEDGENLYHAAADIPVEEDSIQRPNNSVLALSGIISDRS